MPVSITDALPSSFIASDASALGEIKNDETLIAIWQRPPLPELQPALDSFLATKSPIRLDASLSEPTLLKHQLEAHLESPSKQVLKSCVALLFDFQTLAAKFRDISGREHLRLRFERVEDDGCALFHVDTLPLRMLCTYAGPGTQWLDENNVRRNQLGSRGRSIENANEAIVVNPENIHTAPTWHVLVFKGRLWTGHGYSDGLVHRSAPVRHPKDYRLRLTLDFSSSCPC